MILTKLTAIPASARSLGDCIRQRMVDLNKGVPMVMDNKTLLTAIQTVAKGALKAALLKADLNQSIYLRKSVKIPPSKLSRVNATVDIPDIIQTGRSVQIPLNDGTYLDSTYYVVEVGYRGEDKVGHTRQVTIYHDELIDLDGVVIDSVVHDDRDFWDNYIPLDTPVFPCLLPRQHNQRPVISEFDWGRGDYEKQPVHTSFEFLPTVSDLYAKYDEEVVSYYLDFMRRNPDDPIVVIDYGCGKGRLLKKLAQLSHNQVVLIGFDVSGHSISEAVFFDNKQPHPHLHFLSHTLDPDLHDRFGQADITDLMSNIQSILGEYRYKQVKHVVHIDSGGPMHFSVGTKDDAKAAFDEIASSYSEFPNIESNTVISTGLTPSFYGPRDFESQGFRTVEGRLTYKEYPYSTHGMAVYSQ